MSRSDFVFNLILNTFINLDSLFVFHCQAPTEELKGREARRARRDSKRQKARAPVAGGAEAAAALSHLVTSAQSGRAEDATIVLHASRDLPISRLNQEMMDVIVRRNVKVDILVVLHYSHEMPCMSIR